VPVSVISGLPSLIRAKSNTLSSTAAGSTLLLHLAWRLLFHFTMPTPLFCAAPQVWPKAFALFPAESSA